MIDPEVDRLARERIGPRMEERQRLFANEIQVLKNQLTPLGASDPPPPLVRAIQNACEVEAAARVGFSWAELKTVLASTGVCFTEQLAYDLRTEVRRHVDVGDLIRAVNGIAGDGQRVRRVADKELQMLGSDIDLYVADLKRVAEQQGRMGQPILNFHGPVGAVQTGSHATANVSQNFGAEERQALGFALDVLKARIEALETSALPQKFELVELVTDARVEVTRERPNRLRLASVLFGIGTTIQTVGAAQPAYQALKAAAAMVGIALP